MCISQLGVIHLEDWVNVQKGSRSQKEHRFRLAQQNTYWMCQIASYQKVKPRPIDFLVTSDSKRLKPSLLDFALRER